MHEGKLMARLNPPTVRYDIGRGGLPELTAQDIAAAVAMVPAGLGRELLCRIWWPDGARLTAHDLDCILMDAQMGEWRERAEVLLNAQLKQAYAQSQAQRVRAIADAGVAAAKAKTWPRIGPQSCYAAIRKAVLVEMSAACRCTACDGRGKVLTIKGVVDCTACDGTCRQEISDRARAEMIERDAKTYREIWSPVYEWTMDHCRAALSPANARLRAAVA